MSLSDVADLYPDRVNFLCEALSECDDDRLKALLAECEAASGIRTPALYEKKTQRIGALFLGLLEGYAAEKFTPQWAAEEVPEIDERQEIIDDFNKNRVVDIKEYQRYRM